MLETTSCRWGRFARWAVLAVAVLALGGCSSKPVATIRGKVLLRSQPLTKGQIRFYRAGKLLDTACIRKDGTFEATQVAPGAVTVAVDLVELHYRPGCDPYAANPAQRPPTAPVGAPVIPGESPTAAGFFLLPDRYKKPETSSLLYDIPPGTTELTIELY
jgi:hypothetical protein